MVATGVAIEQHARTPETSLALAADLDFEHAHGYVFDLLKISFLPTGGTDRNGLEMSLKRFVACQTFTANHRTDSMLHSDVIQF